MPDEKTVLAPPKNSQVVFFSRPKFFQLDNIKKEERSQMDRLIQPSIPAAFRDHVYVTSDKREIDKIRNCKSFGVVVFECEDMADALKRAQEIDGQRRGMITQYVTTDMSNASDITPFRGENR